MLASKAIRVILTDSIASTKYATFPQMVSIDFITLLKIWTFSAEMDDWHQWQCGLLLLAIARTQMLAFIGCFLHLFCLINFWLQWLAHTWPSTNIHPHNFLHPRQAGRSWLCASTTCCVCPSGRRWLRVAFCPGRRTAGGQRPSGCLPTARAPTLETETTSRHRRGRPAPTSWRPHPHRRRPGEATPTLSNHAHSWVRPRPHCQTTPTPPECDHAHTTWVRPCPRWKTTTTPTVRRAGTDTKEKRYTAGNSHHHLAWPDLCPVSGAADTVADLVEPLQQLNALGEPSLASLGLGGWTPPGLFQQFFEMLHVSAGLPWWGAIAVGESGRTGGGAGCGERWGAEVGAG